MKHWKLICGCGTLAVLLFAVAPLAAAGEDAAKDYPEVL